MDRETGEKQKMTDEKSYEEGRKEIIKIFEARIAANRKLCETYEKLANNTDATPVVKSLGLMGMATTDEFAYLYDGFEKMFLSLSEAFQKIEQRFERLEKATIELGGKINFDEIASVAKFAQDWNKLVARTGEESKKKLEEYKRKMKENDLAT